jgi:hypothetical protein
MDERELQLEAPEEVEEAQRRRCAPGGSCFAQWSDKGEWRDGLLAGEEVAHRCCLHNHLAVFEIGSGAGSGDGG